MQLAIRLFQKMRLSPQPNEIAFPPRNADRPFFVSFAKEAEIGPPKEDVAHKPDAVPPLNDDVCILFNKGGRRALSGNQRKGPMAIYPTIGRHIAMWIWLVGFPFQSQQFPLPPALSRTQIFAAICNPGAIFPSGGNSFFG